MKKTILAILWSGLSIPLGIIHAQDPFADQVVSYTPGTGINASYVLPNSALGAPASAATITVPAFQNTDIVGVGTGGQLTVAFNTPITNNPAGHLGGMDFTIFGNEFFVLSGSTISGVFNHTGLTVWVSQDNVTYYQLVAPYGADDYYPTQANGDPSVPIGASLSIGQFTGQTITQALSLYNGSAGGASYSLSWTQDANGNPVSLPSISYIKIVGTSGFGYVDAVSRVGNVTSVPTPGGAALFFVATGVVLCVRWRTLASKQVFQN